jgi:hypothetical protein
VGRYLGFYHLSQKILDLARFIFDNGHQTDSVLAESVVQCLYTKVNELEEKIWKQGRLPINYDNILEATLNSCRDKMDLKPINRTTLLHAEKQPFTVGWQASNV